MKYIGLLLSLVTSVAFAWEPAKSVDDIKDRFKLTSKIGYEQLEVGKPYRSIVLHAQVNFTPELEQIVIDDFRSINRNGDVDEITVVFIPAGVVSAVGLIGWQYNEPCRPKEVLEAIHMTCKVIKVK